METRVLRYFHKPPKDYKTTVITQTTDVSTALAGKVDKSNGRGLTQNNYTTPEKNKLEGIEPYAEVNVLSDWNTTDTEHDSFIKNKPTKLSLFENDRGFINEVAYDTTNKKLTKTVENVTSDIVTIQQIKTDLLFTKNDVNLSNVTNDALVKRSEMGVANGVATLDNGGLVPSSQLPSYVDDVLEYTSITQFPRSGESGKIYVDTTTNLTYRWSGTTYVEISKSLALGETSSTAYAGDKGKALKDSFNTHAADTGIHITSAERTKWNNNSDADTTLAWSTRSKVGTAGGVDIHVTMPANPNTWPSVTNNNPTLNWNTTSTIATIGSTGIQVTMPANPNTNTWPTAADLTVTIENTSYTLPQIIQNLYNDIQTLKGLWTDNGTSLVAKAGRSATAAGFYDSTVS